MFTLLWNGRDTQTRKTTRGIWGHRGSEFRNSPVLEFFFTREFTLLYIVYEIRRLKSKKRFSTETTLLLRSFLVRQFPIDAYSIPTDRGSSGLFIKKISYLFYTAI